VAKSTARLIVIIVIEKFFGKNGSREREGPYRRGGF
jgi:hypothetical protein